MITRNGCSGLIPMQAYTIIRALLLISYIVIPIILIITLIIDYGKASISNSQEEMKKVSSQAIRRLISAFCAFLVPCLIRYALGTNAVKNKMYQMDALQEYECVMNSNEAIEVYETIVANGITKITMRTNFEYGSVKLPNGNVITSMEKEGFLIDKEGTYKFVFYDKSGHVINTIDYKTGEISSKKFNVSCKVNDKTATISGEKGIEIAGVSYSEGSISNYQKKVKSTTYTLSNKENRLYARIYDKSGNVYEIECDNPASKKVTEGQNQGQQEVYHGASSNGPKQNYSGTNTYIGQGTGCLESVSIPSTYGYRRNGHQQQCLTYSKMKGTISSNCTITVSYNGGVIGNANNKGLCFTPKEFGKSQVTATFSAGCMCNNVAVTGTTTFNISEWGLHSLSISGCAINFYNMTKSYSCTVPDGTTSVTVSATANNVGSKISGTGTRSINVGTNNIAVTTVTPEGATTTYSVAVTRNN